MNKKLVIPFIIFLVLVVTNITSIIKGIEHNETWRIVVAAVSLGLMSVIVAVIAIKTYRRGAKKIS